MWELYRLAHELTGGVSTLLEWDASIPPFPVVHDEVKKAKQFMGAHLPATIAATLPVDDTSAQKRRTRCIMSSRRWSDRR